MQLREYQQDAVNKVVKILHSCQKTLVVSPTGTGKTILFAEIARMASKRCMVIAHREELISQAADKIYKICGQRPDIEQASLYAAENPIFSTKVVVASVQSLNANRSGNRRFQRFDPTDFSLIIIDEAHHAAADSYRRVVDWFSSNPKCKVIGVTATPDRSDKLALGEIFDSVAFDYQISGAVEDGWLVPIKSQIVRVNGLDFSNVKSNKGDFNQKDLALVMEYEQILHGVAVPTIELSDGRKTLVFAASVHQAKRLAEIMNRYKANSAGFVSGKCESDRRRDTIRRFRDGRLQYLVNVGIATEGFDVPDIACVSIARPTQSRSLYAQMIGRGTRPLEGIVDGVDTAEGRCKAIALSDKPDCLVVDFAGNAGKHRLVHAADILGGEAKEQVADRAREKIESGETDDVQQAVEKAKEEIEEEDRVQEKKRSHIKAQKVDYKTKEVHPFDVLGIKTSSVEKGFNSRTDLSGNQLAFLQKSGIEVDKFNNGERKTLWNELIRRIKGGKCSYKQAKLLKRYGIDGRNVSFKQASVLIERLAANNWKPLDF